MDVAIFRAINGAHAAALDPIMLAATWLGVGAGVWFVFALVAMTQPRHRAAAFRAVLALLLTQGLADHIVKPLVGRPRPFEGGVPNARMIQSPRPTTGSFPSGHAASAVAGAIAMSRIWPQASWAFAALGALIAYSRIYVGVHYPSDVLAGALLGLACAWLALGGRHRSTWTLQSAPAPGVQRVP